MDWMLPGVEPTGKKVRVPFVVIVKFEGDKVRIRSDGRPCRAHQPALQVHDARQAAEPGAELAVARCAAGVGCMTPPEPHCQLHCRLLAECTDLAQAAVLAQPRLVPACSGRDSS